MTKREIKKARKAIQKTREKWGKFDRFYDVGHGLRPYPVDHKTDPLFDSRTCPICSIVDCCHDCIVYTLLGITCSFVEDAVKSQRRTRPVWRVLDRMDRALDKIEAENGDR